MRASPFSRFALVVVAVGLACKCTPPTTTNTDTTVVFDLTANLDDAAHFFDAPYPSDLRLNADGTPDVKGFPNPNAIPQVDGFVQNASEAHGFPVLPVAHFQFTKPVATRAQGDVIAADVGSPILLVDIDPTSPEEGKLIPTVASTLPSDPYTPDNLLAVASRAGWVLRPKVQYAFVVMQSANDASGKPLGLNATLEKLKKHAPTTDAEKKADAVFTPLWSELDKIGVDKTKVAAATVFTTGQVAQELSDLGTLVKTKYAVTIDNLKINPDPAEVYPQFCYLTGTVTYPQFQTGTPPFETDGRFTFDASGMPIKQRDEVAPLILLIPSTPMPAKGYPIMFNIHGSGGYSVAAVRPVGDNGLPGDPIGPAFVITPKGIAIAGSAMPLNPERFPGATETEYLNPDNIAAMRDTFRQGTIEQRLFMEAVKNLELDPTMLGTCTGPTIPAGEKIKFDTDLVLLTGQSMGGMYTNIIGATSPEVKAVVPTGAGGFWTYFIFVTPLENGAFPGLLKLVLDTKADLSYLHPVFALGEAALEPSDSIVFMPHLARRPLPGHPVRPIYRPVGIGDSYFPTQTYDAVALSYAHKQAGDIIWQSMQDALKLEGLDGIVPYVVQDEMMSENGTPYTGVVAQFMADGDYDPHALYSHHDGVKHQYGCFWDSFVKTGHARVPPPTKPFDAPCE